MPTAPAHDGGETIFRLEGQGFPVLMSPLRPRGRIAEGYVARLRDRYRVVLMGYPGRPKPDTLTPDAAVGDVLAVADAAGVDRFVWWGYSWGSVLGLQLAARTDRLAGFICGGWTPVGAPYASMLSLSTRMARLTRRMGKRLSASAAQYVTFYRALQEWDEQQALDALRGVPRLLFVGANDNGRRAALARTVRAHRPELEESGWTVTFLDGQRHYVVTRPSVLVPPVRQWLDHQPLE